MPEHRPEISHDAAEPCDLELARLTLRATSATLAGGGEAKLLAALARSLYCFTCWGLFLIKVAVLNSSSFSPPAHPLHPLYPRFVSTGLFLCTRRHS